MDVLSATAWLVYAVVFALGLSLGSFLNSWVWRRRENIRIAKGRSMCPSCRRQLSWYENIPVISYLFLVGKCRTCKNPIPWHFTLIELGTALIFLFIAWHNLNQHGGKINPIHLVHEITFVILLIVIFIYDFLYQIVLSEIIWVGVAAGIIFGLYTGMPILSMLIGLGVGAGFFLLQYVVSNGKWIGGGDVRLGLMMGIWLGWPNILVALAIAYVVGAVFSLGLILLKGRKFSSSTPFGTYLAVGTFVTMIWGNQIVEWYLSVVK